MSDRRLLALTGLTAVALVLTVGAGAVVGASSAAADLAPRVQTALAAAGLEDVRVVIHGREVEVRDGTLDELTEAMAIAERVPGVRTASVDERPGAVDRVDTTRPFLRLRRDRDRLRILGAVPTAADAATVKASAARAFGVPVRGDLVIDTSLPGADWTGELPDAFGDMVGVTDMDLTVDGDTLRLAGSIDSGSERADVLALVRSSVPSLMVQSTVQIAPSGAGAS